MGFLSGQVVFIVWRETTEAVLIIGIIYAFLKKTSDTKGLQYMWGGILGGVLLSLLLGLGMMEAQDLLEGRALTYFQVGVLAVSSLMMTQMVFWMSKHGRHLKGEIERELGGAVNKSNLWGVAIVSALAIAREGVETVIYLYGISLQGQLNKFSMIFSTFTAVCLATLMAWVVAKGFRYFNSRIFFKITGIALLLSASGLLVSSLGKLIQEGLIPGIIEPVWNTTHWIPMEGTFAKILVSFVGYNPRPSLVEALCYGLYWVVVLGLFNFKKMDLKFKKLKTVEG